MACPVASRPTTQQSTPQPLMHTIRVDDMLTIEVCSVVRLRQRQYVCGRQISKCLTLNHRSWLTLNQLDPCIKDDIDTISRNQVLSKQYNIGNGCCIIMNTTSQFIAFHYWVRHKSQQFRPTLSTLRITFSQWALLMGVNIHKPDVNNIEGLFAHCSL